MPDTPPRLERIFQSYDPPLYFVTFNTHQRREILANEGVHRAFIQFAHKGERHGACIGRYVMMPDHIHLFIRGSDDFILSQWVRMLKRALSKAISSPPPHWQKGFFDHLIRHGESYSAKWDYVHQNPVRAGLVTAANAWPWQDEIVRLEM